MFRPLEYFIIDALSRLSSQDESHVYSHAYTSSCFDTPVTIDRSVLVSIDIYIHIFLIIFTNLWVGLGERERERGTRNKQ